MELSKIIQIVKLGVMAIPAVVVLIAIIATMHRPHQGKPDPATLLKRIFRQAGVIVLAAVVYAAMFVCVRYGQSLITGEMVIGFNYAEASRGLNPNSTRFNTYDIIEDAVLEQAIRDGGFAVSVEDLRETLSVVPLEAGEAVSGEHYYVASEYVLTYEASFKTLSLSAEDVLLAVSGAYYDQFLDSFSRKTSVLELDFAQLEDTDYLDQIDILEKMAGDVSEYMKMCSLESGTYIGSSGESFSSLGAKVQNFGKVELEKLRGYVLTNGLSKDKQMQISKLEYENLIKDISYDKNLAAYGIGLEAIEMYERDMGTIVLVPTRDETGEFYMSRTKLGTDNFADQSYQYSQRATSVEADINANTYAIGKLSGSAATENQYAELELMIESFKKNLNAFAKSGIDMVTAYDDESKGSFLNFNHEVYDITHKDNLSKYAVLMVLMIFAGCVYVCVMPTKQKRPRKQKKQKQNITA